MSEKIRLLQNICKKEEEIFGLLSILNDSDNLWEFFKPKEPQKPIEPYVQAYDIPPYDDEKYKKMAKASGAGLGKFREECVLAGFWMACSFIGLTICWIPWLIALFSFPFSIHNIRKKAHQLYENECKEIIKKNNEAKLAIKEYQHNMVSYNRAMEEYQRRSALLPNTQRIFDSKLNDICNEIREKDTQLQELYNELRLTSEYRNFVATNTILWYIENNIAKTFEDAIVCFDRDKHSGKILSKEDILKYNKLLDYPARHIYDIISVYHSKTGEYKGNFINEVYNGTLQ